MAEQHDDMEEQDNGEDDTDEVQDADTMDAPPSLEEVLQTEAAELEQAAEEGADDEVLGGLEASVEAGAKALVSMREARTRLQAVRKQGSWLQDPGPNVECQLRWKRPRTWSHSPQEAIRQASHCRRRCQNVDSKIPIAFTIAWLRSVLQKPGTSLK